MRIIHLNGETWAVCGGRNFRDVTMFRDAMSAVMELRDCPSRIVHGNARGADSLASAWAQGMGLEVVAVEADWNTYGKRAGPIRNQKILDEHKPSALVAFPGGRGTADMINRCRKAGIDVIEIKPTPLAPDTPDAPA